MRNCGGGVCVRWGVSKNECPMSCRLKHCSIQERGGERERESNRHKVWGGGTQRKRDREREKGGESMNVYLVTI